MWDVRFEWSYFYANLFSTITIAVGYGNAAIDET